MLPEIHTRYEVRHFEGLYFVCYLNGDAALGPIPHRGWANEVCDLLNADHAAHMEDKLAQVERLERELADAEDLAERMAA